MKNSIFVDCHVFDGGFQGSRSYIKGLYSELLNNHSDMKIYMAAYDIENLRNEFGEYENLIYLKYSSKNKFFRLSFEIPYLLRKNSIECAHFQYMVPIFKMCKEIVTIHDMLFLDYPMYFGYKYKILYNILFKIAAKRADLLLTVSQYSRKRISHHCKINLDDIFVIPNGVNTKTLQPRQIQKMNYKFILYVSRIEERKNHLSLLKAYVKSNLWISNMKLIFAGKQSSKTMALYQYLDSLPSKIKQNVVFCVPDNDTLAQLLNNCECFVYPSIAEGFGIPPLEAAVLGKKVLCSDTTAMADFKNLGFCMFDPFDIDALSIKLKNICDEKNVKSHNNITEILQTYQWEHISSQYRLLLNGLFNK